MHKITTNVFTPSPKNFNLMVLGQISTVLGSALLRFALSLYILDTTGSEALFATLYAVSSIPLLLSPLGGAIADRFNRRNLMVIYDLTNGVIVLSLFILMGAGVNSVFMIGAVMVLLSIISAFDTPTVTACIPILVANDKLAGANGIVQAVQALSAVVTPILGGILYGVFGVQTLIVISCAAFFLTALMESCIKIPFEKREQEGHIVKTIAKDLKEGFTYVIRQRVILKAGILAVLLNLILSPYFIVGAPIVLRVTMGSGDAQYGVGMSLINLATILGALLIGLLSKRMRLKTLHRWILAAALLLIPMAVSLTPFMLGLGYYPSFIVFMMGAIPIAMCMTIISLFFVTQVQKMTPNENLGKVMAIIMAVAQCAAPLGQILYGIIFGIFKAEVFIPTLVVGAATLLLAVMTRHLMKNEEEPA